MATRVSSPVLLAALLLAACQADPPDRAAPGAYQTRAAAYQVGVVDGPREPQWLVRVADGEEPDLHEIRQFAVAGDHIYFTTGWEAVYRVASTGGGPVEVIDSGGDAFFEHIAGVGDQVVWLNTTFDDRDYPRIRLRRGGSRPAQTIFEGDLATLSSNASVQFQASAGGVVFSAAPSGSSGDRGALLRISLPDGAVTTLLSIGNIFATPPWTLDGSHLHLASPEGPSTPVPLSRVALNGGTFEGWATVPAAGAQVRAADDSDVFLTTDSEIWRASKQTGEVTRIVASERLKLHPWLLKVDQTDVYFIEHRGGMQEIRAVPRGGGGSRLLALQPTAGGRWITQLEQDAQSLFVLQGWNEIAVVQKHPTPRVE